MVYFFGILDGQDDVWGVRIPDVPGCFGGGATAEDAVRDAISALCAMADEAQLVSPRSMAEIAHDPSAEFKPAEGESLIMLPFLAGG
jgi:predicted RNase H-like HicB family nuclease